MVWRTDVSARLNTALTTQLLLVIAVGAGLSSLGWLAYQDWSLSLDQTSVTQNPLPANQVAGDAISVSALSDAQLFGKMTVAKPQPSNGPINAPETRLRLVLRGAFAYSSPEQSKALIAEQGKNAKLYHVNDQLPSGATLDQVAADHVILNRAGTLETLSFHPNKKKRAGVVRTATNELERNEDLATQAIVTSQQSTLSIKERLKRLRQARDL